VTVILMPRKKSSAPRKEVIQSPALKKEVKCIGLAAGGVLLFIGVFIPGALGPVGMIIHNFLRGIFGLGAYVLPVALVALAVLLLTSQKIRVPIVQSALLILFVLTFLHTINRMINPPPDYLVGFAFIRSVYETGAVIGGGVTGALLGEILHRLLGGVGTIIVLVVGIIILLVLLTGRSFVDFVGRGMDKAKDFYDERAAAREYFNEDYDHVQTQPLQRGKKGKILKPLPQRQKATVQGGHTQGFMDIEPVDVEDTADILLISEQLEEESRKIATKAPLFARRTAFLDDDTKGRKRTKRGAEIVAFPDRNSAVAEAVAPVIHGLAEDVAMAEEETPILTLYEKPAPVNEEQLFDDDFDDDGFDDYEDEIDDGFYNDFDDESEMTFSHQAQTQETLHEIKINSAVPLRDEETKIEQANGFGEDFDNDFHDDEVIIPVKVTPTAAAPRFAPMPAYENYQMPPITFLTKNEKPQASAETRTQVHKNSITIEETLRNFRIEAKVVEVSIGPTVTRYDLTPGPGVKVSAIANLSNDLALALAAQGLRIEAPIPGKSAVGIEVPNAEPQGVFLRDILEHEKFETFPSKLAFAVGKDIAGAPVVTDVARMPHLLIAGATGSGKSVCINTLIASLLYKARPDEVKLLMIDPKVVELSVYNGIPHLLIPVVTDPKKASGALSWAVQEMENRYTAFAETGCRDLKGYNRVMIEKNEQKLPQIVIIIDELADLMMTCKGEVEESICRLAQKARAAGIHLIVATQRPSVDVITGLIKANIPSRLAFAVSSGTDSRTVLDMYGAEKLLGRGDMLFLPVGQNKPIRVQGGFISDKEVEELVIFLKAQAPVEHTTEMIQQITMPGKAKIEGDVDEYFHEAIEFLLTKGKGSTSMLQRQFRIGYNRASRLMEDLEIRGIVGPEDGVKPRKVTITREEYREIYG